MVFSQHNVVMLVIVTFYIVTDDYSILSHLDYITAIQLSSIR